MEKIKLKDYKNDCVCILDNESVDGIYLVGTDDVEEIRAFKEAGYTIYGTTLENVFDENFIQEIQSKFEDYADEHGYADINDNIDYQGEDFKKVKEAIKEFIKSLGDTNKCYWINKSVIVEL
ncbi:hypothetical protein [Fusobacterium mortiferum]|uniref:General stress protein 17M-like domain-containing protein n=1 Tax=Fusobacterium mortiferum TaxID=850 RepID=A0ABS2G1I6_FUSMR|nr:hypothetical protein [Fusobacterium mortiferum]MBM6874712.1 hypothetical protein [Fusobacterium mortiferum]